MSILWGKIHRTSRRRVADGLLGASDPTYPFSAWTLVARSYGLPEYQENPTSDARYRKPLSQKGRALEIALSYDRLGSRLRSIGGVPIGYDWLGNRPSTLGTWSLSYDRLGNRLIGIGTTQISYDMLGSRPSAVGSWSLTYDHLGNRLIQLGPYELTYDHLGSRVRILGPLAISYDRLGSRPRTVTLPPGQTALSPELLLGLFFVLYQATRRRRRSAS
jgi:hypothetical protein